MLFRSTRIVAIRHAMKLRMMQAPARPETLAAAALPSPSRLPMRIVVARPTENGTGKSEAAAGCEGRTKGGRGRLEPQAVVVEHVTERRGTHCEGQVALTGHQLRRKVEHGLALGVVGLVGRVWLKRREARHCSEREARLARVDCRRANLR